MDLSALLEEIDKDMADLKRRITEILTFDPDRLKSDIVRAKVQLVDARASAQANELLRPLLGQINEIEQHLKGVSAVADQYEEVYRNIIRPVQLEGQSGVRATVRWAIISIVASTVISIVLDHWNEIIEALKKLC